MGNGRERIFACTACGSPAVSVPASLDAAAYVHCDGCGRALMPWGDFKARIEAVTGPAGRTPPDRPQGPRLNAGTPWS